MLTARGVGYRPGMSAFLDTTTGMGLSGATGVRPYLRPLLAGALARADAGIDFDGTDWHFLESTGFLVAVLALGLIAYLTERSAANRRAVELFGGVAGRLRRRRRPGPRRHRDLPAAGVDPRDRRLRRAARPRPPARRREVRRAARAALVAGATKKLVLAVIDSLKPDMLDLAIEEGRAPTLAALRDRGTYIRDCLSTFPSVTPVASAAIATGCGPGEHHIPSMNWYH